MCLKAKWYLQAYLPANQAYRLFKLRRIYNVHVETDTYTSRVLPHPFEDFTSRMGGKTFPIKLLIVSSALHRMLDYCTMDDVTEADNGKYMVNLNFVNDDYGYGILMSFGNKLICIEPDYVRLELIKRLDGALSQYADK